MDSPGPPSLGAGFSDHSWSVAEARGSALRLRCTAMLFLNYRLAVIGLLVCSRICLATTIVAIVSPDGMTIASDTGARHHTETNVPISRERTIKFAPVQNHLIVAVLGTSDAVAVRPDGTRYNYHFIEWITKLQEGLPPDVTPDALSQKIATEATVVFEPFNEELRSGRMKQGNLQEKFKLLAEYAIFGYSHGQARIYVVQFYIDWDNKKVLEPKTFLLHPGADTSSRGYVFYSFGITQALDDMRNTSSYAFQQVIRQCPTLQDLFAGHDIGMDTVLNVARAEIEVEEKVNPTVVFGDISTIRLLPDGTIGPIKTFSPGHKVLCQPTRGKSK